MPRIEQLAPHVADLVAAGEVVERPASVVKELIENAIDAGSTAIVVELQNGGMTLIRVTDNGAGISADELPTAFLRHATSKLRKSEDLAAIGTLGFRGEALAAIAAVSRLDVFTRQKGAEQGASLHLEGSVPGVVEPAGCPEGSTFAVRDLFYNTPARLKFLKTDSAEASAAGTMIAQIALSHPEVSIRYLRDGKEELHTPGDGKLLSAIYAARGREFALSLREVDGGGEGVRVHGYVTEPLASRGSRAMQSFFCCGRMIKSSLLTAALEEAYANRQMKGRYPGCVLHIDLPLTMVDVNVHPAKTVVKFVNERAVFSAVHHTIRDVLDAAGQPAATPSVSIPTVPGKPATAASQPREDFYQTMDAKTFREKAVKREPIKKTGPVSTVRLSDTAPRHVSAPPPIALTSELGGHLTFHDSARPARQPRQALDPTPQFTVHTLAAPPEAEQAAMMDKPAPWRFAGEVLHTYIIAEDGEDIWLIDKHAAHERINFDRLKANPEPVMRQQLLAPLAVDLPGEQYAVLIENLSLLEEFGFEAEDFGSGCIMVRAIPSDIDTGLVRETLEMLAEKILTGGSADPSAARDAMLHTMACKAAIKGGWTSDPAELKVLIAKVQSGEVQYCPHGRPVKVKISRYEIEKMFKRA